MIYFIVLFFYSLLTISFLELNKNLFHFYIFIFSLLKRDKFSNLVKAESGETFLIKFINMLLSRVVEPANFSALLQKLLLQVDLFLSPYNPQYRLKGWTEFLEVLLTKTRLGLIKKNLKFFYWLWIWYSYISLSLTFYIH